MQKIDHPLLPPMVDLDDIEAEIVEGTDFAAPTALSPIHYQGHTALQIIAQGIIRLPWREAEKMAAGIAAENTDGLSLAAQIQAWAEKWEKFK